MRTTSELLALFNENMQGGHELLGDGDFAGAAELFDEAHSFAEKPIHRIQAAQMRGIALSRDGRLKDAVAWFNAAIETARHTREYSLTFRVERDLAMAYVDAAQRWRYILRRDELLRDADILLRRSHEGLQKLGQHEEAWVTAGFMGRVELVAGSRFNAEKALRNADQELRQIPMRNRDYVLNNKMWLLRAVSRKERRAMEPEILDLIEKTGQHRRNDELRLIMLGGDGLYRFVRALPSWTTRLIKRMFGS